MKKTYKKGMTIKVIGEYISLSEKKDIICEIVFCNNRSLLVKVNDKLNEIPEEAVICTVDTVADNKNITEKKNKDNKPKNNSTASKPKNKKQNAKNTVPQRGNAHPTASGAVKNKRSRSKCKTTLTLTYTPSKNRYYGYNRCSKSNNYSLGTAHDRAYWALTHPFVGGACCPR